MIMEKITSLLAIVAFVCWGCSQRREQSARFSEDQISQLGLESTKQLVVLNENSLKLDLDNFLSDRTLQTVELIDSIQYIPLQTTKESLIGEINKLICVASNYFILDAYTGRNVLIFSNDGTFIKTLSTGQGPRDIFRPQDIAVDEARKHLIVYHSTGLSFYDYVRKNYSVTWTMMRIL